MYTIHEAIAKYNLDQSNLINAANSLIEKPNVTKRAKLIAQSFIDGINYTPSHVDKITQSSDCYTVIKRETSILTSDVEKFGAIFLNRRNKVIAVHGEISKGGLSSCLVDVRVIYQQALSLKASSIIVFHNHPSGALIPSNQDTVLTKKIYQAGEVLDIKLLDHIIVTPSGYYSFADEGRL